MDAERSISAVNALIEAFNRRDAAAVAALLDDDIVCHGIPLEPAHGLAATMALLAPFIAAAAIDWEVLTISATGHTVFAERIDRFRFAGQGWTEVRAVGVFVVNADGRISAWRDYFDMAELVAALPPQPAIV